MSITITPKLICDIIQDGMSLNDDQIWIYNQRRAIPQDKRLYVVVGLISSRVYGNNGSFNSTTNSNDVGVWIQELISIDLFSYTLEAQERVHEAIGSLQSTYSIQQQELNGMQIAAIPLHITDTSTIEGPAMLNRLSLSLNVLRKYDILKASQYFSEFSDVEIHSQA